MLMRRMVHRRSGDFIGGRRNVDEDVWKAVTGTDPESGGCTETGNDVEEVDVMATILDYALSYIKKFHAIVPCGAWTFIGRDGDEVDMWKHPLIKNWTQEPLKTEVQARNFWRWQQTQYKKTPMIGVATGQICGGYIVIDFDNKPEKCVDGWEYKRGWEKDTGLKLPDTWIVRTGGGGRHLWYKTDKAMRGWSNTEIGVDLRADGNFIVVPPSLHKSGKCYEWEIDSSPRDIECAEANEAVFEFLAECRPADAQFTDSNQIGPRVRRENAGERVLSFPEHIPKGHRHKNLVSLIGTLNRLGVSDEGIEMLIRYENEHRCEPPMTETELQKEIFSAIYTFPKGVPADRWKPKEQFLKDQNTALLMERRKEQVMKSLQS